jgi:hypothetical protein
VRRGRCADAIFKYAEHQCDDVLYVHFVPGERVIHVEFIMEYCNIDAVFEFDAADDSKTVHILRVLCKTRNFWPEIQNFPKQDRCDSGGVRWYRRHADLLDDIELETLVRRFFGEAWRLGPLPMTLPKPTAEQLAVAAACEQRLGDYHGGPWSRVIGTYFYERERAATAIQKYFRGWRVRMATTFNPDTPIGYLLEMRRFRALVAEEDSD